MFIMVLSSFSSGKPFKHGSDLTTNIILECSVIIKLVDIYNIRKEIYSYLKKNKNCGFPLITNYLSKEEYKINKNILQSLYYKFTDLEKYYVANSLGSLAVYNDTKNIHIDLAKVIKIEGEKHDSYEKELSQMYMNNLVIQASNVMLSNLDINLSNDKFKKIRLVDKYINNFITHRKDYNFLYRLYEEDEKRSTSFDNEDLNNLLLTVVKN